jgi:hypothetical protein
LKIIGTLTAAKLNLARIYYIVVRASVDVLRDLVKARIVDKLISRGKKSKGSYYITKKRATIARQDRLDLSK